jgi:hypothetical protein
VRTSNATLHADTITGAINCFDNPALYNQTKRTMHQSIVTFTLCSFLSEFLLQNESNNNLLQSDEK